MTRVAAHSYAFLRVEVDADRGIATVTMNRPEVRNALHLPMNLEIRQALETLADDDRVRALVLTGAGDASFVSGADIAELRDRRGPVALARHNAKLCDAIEAFPYPTVAAINGYALGGGCEIALACDLRVAVATAKLGQPEVSLGILPAAGGTWRLQRVVGLAKAKELIFTAAIIDAAEAHAIGLVNHVVAADAPGGVLAAAQDLAARCAKQSAMALRLAKIAVNQGREASRDTGLALEALAQTVLYDDDEKMARMTRFLERKRDKGRDKSREQGGDNG